MYRNKYLQYKNEYLKLKATSSGILNENTVYNNEYTVLAKVGGSSAEIEACTQEETTATEHAAKIKKLIKEYTKSDSRPDYSAVQSFLNDGTINEHTINLSGFRGNTLLHLASYDGCTDDIVSELIKKNADVNKKCRGYSPLHIASKYGHHKIVELLLKSNEIEINDTVTKNKRCKFINYYECAEDNGCTALMLAIRNCDKKWTDTTFIDTCFLKVVKLLLNDATIALTIGTDPEIAALSIARKKLQTEIDSCDEIFKMICEYTEDTKTQINTIMPYICRSKIYDFLNIFKGQVMSDAVIKLIPTMVIYANDTCLDSESE